MKTVNFLTKKELQKIENFQANTNNLQQAKDLFIFQSYTGLAYIDLMNLTSENIKTGATGETNIEGDRQKNKAVFIVPLLPQAKEILAKYGNKPENLPHFTNQDYNLHLKEICNVIGLKKQITIHTARKTFAKMALNVWNIPIETVCKMLGHYSIELTQKFYNLKSETK